jgi:hypothetical protein
MSIASILAAIDEQISNLERVRGLLATAPAVTGKRRGRPAKASMAKVIASSTVPSPAGKRKKRKMSAEGRARIVAAQKARWAKTRKSSKA